MIAAFFGFIMICMVLRILDGGRRDNPAPPTVNVHVDIRNVNTTQGAQTHTTSQQESEFLRRW